MTITESNQNHSTALPTGEWRVVPDGSEIGFRTRALGFLPVRGRFSGFAGTLRVDEDGRATGSLTVEVETIGTGISKRDTHLRTSDFFHVELHPHMRFTLESLHPVADGSFRVTGTLHIRDRRLQIDVPATVASNPTQLQLSTRFDIDHHSAGFEFKHLPKRVQVEASLALTPTS